jgi:hypothetical protein
MDGMSIWKKLGADYPANDLTFKMGLDIRFAMHIANRFNAWAADSQPSRRD